MPPLNPVRVFEVAAHHATLAAASEELCVTQGAVSRQVKVLEEYLGFELFERSASGLQLTEAGRSYARSLRKAFDLVATATDDLIATQSSTMLTLQAFNTFFSRWLIPRLPAFHRACPHIKLRLVVLTNPTSFSRDATDLAIFYGDDQWPQYNCDLLFRDQLTPVCRPGLVAPGAPVQVLSQHALIHSIHQRSQWSRWFAQAGHPEVEGREALWFEDLGIAYQCAIEGLGVAMGQLEYLRDELASGKLVAPFDQVLRPDSGYYLIRRKRETEPQKIAAFRSWLLAQVRDEAQRDGVRTYDSAPPRTP